MFTKVLVANRGEIAVRVIRACQDLGIGTVAVYSDLDRNALHVRLADEAYALGGQTAAESYLNTDAILDVIERSGAQAVHPGYGFFSENADFARAITDRGVAFIGPRPRPSRSWATRSAPARLPRRSASTAYPAPPTSSPTPRSPRIRRESRIPRGHQGCVRRRRPRHEGRRSADEVESAIESAQRESLAYFGRDEIYMERYLTKPRHVEVQVLADTHGNCVYLGTRDCSAQRRHQKLIEEAPAAGIDPESSRRWARPPSRLPWAADTRTPAPSSSCTRDGAFYYLEMNTRLQVEHPVTEAVTGVDLVEQQLRVAAGEPLAMTQDDVTISGTPSRFVSTPRTQPKVRFLPSPGPITALRAPAVSGTRWDGGYEAGDEISQYYDNLVGKLVCWGPTETAPLPERFAP